MNANLKNEGDSMREKITIWIAWHLPRYLVMWCAVRVHAHATTGQYSSQVVPDLTAMDALKRWDAPQGPAHWFNEGRDLMREHQ